MNCHFKKERKKNNIHTFYTMDATLMVKFLTDKPNHRPNTYFYKSFLVPYIIKSIHFFCQLKPVAHVHHIQNEIDGNPSLKISFFSLSFSSSFTFNKVIPMSGKITRKINLQSTEAQFFFSCCCCCISIVRDSVPVTHTTLKLII